RPVAQFDRRVEVRARALVADDEDLVALAPRLRDELERARERAGLEEAVAVGVGLKALPAPVVAVLGDEGALDGVLARGAAARQPAAFTRQAREERVVTDERVIEVDADAQVHFISLFSPLRSA